ncbi:hypothetical protein [Nocardia blacklockiae]|uniref:hypothetical protein n=1 Tax=Nocardia blacklockiae TaxID=480036 RepID=UPI001893C534|nr:hypothetical protein [Nocardia blacklockiae]MBF6172694.1 hypothetical protein [Nocardia blacklockiae]
MTAPEYLYVDIPACRALADGLGTAGEEIRVLGRGGAIADGVTDGLPGARLPDVCRAAARSADHALSAVATALLELGGTVVGAVATVAAQERTNSRDVTQSV